jgi:hypothetical protein
MTTRGRKSTSIAPVEKPVIDHDAGQRGTMALQAVAEQQQAAQANAVALAEQFGYEGALTVSGLEDEIRFFQRRSVEAVLETGKRLLLLKEITAHGEFMERLEGLGIGQSLANKLMSATLKFSNSESTTILALPNLNQGKLLELLVLDDDEIEALDQGTTVRGVKLDDIDCMSVSELRRALRVSAAEQAAKLADKDAVIAQKAAKIDELVEAKNRREGLTGAELHDELERELTEATLTAIGTMTALRVRIDDINGLDKLPQGLYVACANALQRVVSEAMGIAADYGIQLTLAAELDGDDSFDNPNAGEYRSADGPEQAD